MKGLSQWRIIIRVNLSSRSSIKLFTDANLSSSPFPIHKVPRSVVTIYSQADCTSRHLTITSTPHRDSSTNMAAGKEVFSNLFTTRVRYCNTAIFNYLMPWSLHLCRFSFQLQHQSSTFLRDCSHISHLFSISVDSHNTFCSHTHRASLQLLHITSTL